MNHHKHRKLDSSTFRPTMHSLSVDEVMNFSRDALSNAKAVNLIVGFFSVFALNDNKKILLEPYNYLIANPGKDIRGKLIDAFDHWLKVPKDKLSTITTVVEMLHTASLLIDDVEDDSVLRRGVPVAHSIYGVPATINCANYVYFLALNELTKFDNSEMLKIYTSELINLHRGQGMELHWRDTLSCPSETEFIEMIRDDYMNLQSKKYADNKGFCEDLTEGKFSFPIIHSIHSDPNDRRLINILKQHTTSIDLKQYAINIMTDTGSFEYTRNYLAKTENSVREKIKTLGGNPLLENIIDLLTIKE
ncbi:18913_t:CDS:2 [Racocetra persica]|uniref:18913_t:CDS:1 n=1 Tax=Racocetra persica TaxID=160502 RepID=A0ACA9NK44_9GLOM|nr:18913_t:CDS:2 [Racocetra persica]